MTAALEAKNVCKTYVVNKRQNNVLRNVSFDVEDGELVAVMGPSGSGKTTLLYAVSGMDEVTSGSVGFYGQELTQVRAKEMATLRLDSMGFIFQQMYMLKNLTIADNILLPAFQSKKNRGTAKRREKSAYAHELMYRMGIAELARNDITEVSGGQLQRACICRSLINDPQMVFADEPTGSLNKQASNEVMDQIVTLNRAGTTVMLVTHDIRVAAKCDRVLYLIDGSINGDLALGKHEGDHTLKDRERRLNNWLLDKGW
ncbi:MAG: ABC transporter ATP-binding protein [Coriobacteriales bacterium]|jgi:putative ABC transport system ATP-binding protein|nr:ABC transporter ATP-binding protein [Coriobacteriales bacterium]